MLTSGIFAKSIMVTLGRWARSHHGAFLCRVAAAKRNAIIWPWRLVLAKLRCRKVRQVSPERHRKNRRLCDKFRYHRSFFAGCSYALSSIVAWTIYSAMMSSSPEWIAVCIFYTCISFAMLIGMALVWLHFIAVFIAVQCGIQLRTAPEQSKDKRQGQSAGREGEEENRRKGEGEYTEREDERMNRKKGRRRKEKSRRGEEEMRGGEEERRTGGKGEMRRGGEQEDERRRGGEEERRTSGGCQQRRDRQQEQTAEERPS